MPPPSALVARARCQDLVQQMGALAVLPDGPAFCEAVGRWLLAQAAAEPHVALGSRPAALAARLLAVEDHLYDRSRAIRRASLEATTRATLDELGAEVLARGRWAGQQVGRLRTLAQEAIVAGARARALASPVAGQPRGDWVVDTIGRLGRVPEARPALFRLRLTLSSGELVVLVDGVFRDQFQI